MKLIVQSNYKKLNYPGIAYPITVNADGTEIIYRGAPVNQFLVKGKKHRKGHYAVCIENQQIYRSKLVALAWVPNPNNYPLVLHNNCDTTYDYYRNLNWGTRAMMVQNMQVQGIIGGANPKFRGSSKISAEEAEAIALRLKNGDTGRSIAAEYQVSEMAITRIRKRYLKTE
ncbi:helix-turn-helix domain-containing protein [uncultured Draconibacterium sp.]|uniref:helix-turn-helix domain-containing protein n=1 Tax=uncultured Draconibacterium sp. TaxID=1573823 RepID=UPI0029C93D84|nr:helix-turn-helix domain-containing protein [uncultured Draconibacterium sp.]